MFCVVQGLFLSRMSIFCCYFVTTSHNGLPKKLSVKVGRKLKTLLEAQMISEIIYSRCNFAAFLYAFMELIDFSCYRCFEKM